ncbi:MAG: hypothetical protein PHW99_10475, partial [Rhodoferax sp.]|nr:hypothetical protein [Rhodoferax sp.]
MAVHNHLWRVFAVERASQLADHFLPIMGGLFQGRTRVPLSGIINVIIRHLFSPPNNTRLAHLCGPMDAH